MAAGNKAIAVERPVYQRARSSGIGGAGNMRRPSGDVMMMVQRPVVERVRSSGIGGAGNMRRPSEVKAALELIEANGGGKTPHSHR